MPPKRAKASVSDDKANHSRCGQCEEEIAEHVDPCIMCDECSRWFHGACVSLPRTSGCWGGYQTAAGSAILSSTDESSRGTGQTNSKAKIHCQRLTNLHYVSSAYRTVR